MPWRVGEKVPTNVYDDDRPVCQCHNEEDAARIVIAVNALGVTGTCYARLPNGWCILPWGHEGEHKPGTGDD